jgi:cytochrome c-type biogenesis protein CcmH/NrfG
VNSVAYRLLCQKRTADAIQLFKLNTELHPQSANTFDSLGEAYMESGDNTLAIENYQKSLSLDPNNSNAATRLKKLGAN